MSVLAYMAFVQTDEILTDKVEMSILYTSCLKFVYHVAICLPPALTPAFLGKYVCVRAVHHLT